jgi:hypothetical protein
MASRGHRSYSQEEQLQASLSGVASKMCKGEEVWGADMARLKGSEWGVLQFLTFPPGKLAFWKQILVPSLVNVES